MYKYKNSHYITKTKNNSNRAKCKRVNNLKENVNVITGK